MADRSAIEWTDATWNPVTGAPRLLEDATIATLSDLRNDLEGSLDILSRWGSI